MPCREFKQIQGQGDDPRFEESPSPVQTELLMTLWTPDRVMTKCHPRPIYKNLNSTLLYSSV